MRDNRLALITGVDIPIPELQLTMHQPRIKEISYMGESDFFLAVQYLCLKKEALTQDKTLLSELDNFQIFMKVLSEQKTSERKKQIITLLSILFPERQPAIMPASISFISLKEGEEPIMIDSSNFEYLQNIIRETLCLSALIQGDQVEYNPQGKAAKKIADKLMAGRKKVAELKAKENSGDSVIGRYMSILSVAKICTLEESSEYTLYQLLDQIDRFSLWLDWEIDLKIKLTGTKTEKQVENWMKPIH